MQTYLKERLAMLDQTRFLTECRNQEVSRATIESFLVQHYHYARHFTRYLCALLVHLPNDDDRRELCENLFEEMGLGELGDEPHSKIYRTMLDRLGLDPDSVPVHPTTRKLIDCMQSLSGNPDSMIGLGALFLGAEAAVPHIYSQILTGCLAAGFKPQDLLFFELHIEGDDDHAETMAQIVQREAAKDPGALARLQAAADQALSARAQFFEGLYEFTEVDHSSHQLGGAYAVQL